jgi:hypothetical protein
MTMRTTLCVFAAVAVAALRQVSAAAAFAPSTVASVRFASSCSGGGSSSRCYQVSPPTPPNKGSSEDFINDEELLFPVDTTPSSSVDWDAEWKKVVKEQKYQPSSKEKKRPGEGYYKSEAEIRAIKAANKAAAKLNEAQANMPSLPTWNAVKDDWKFWVGLLLILSIGSSLLAANSGPGIVYNQPPPGTGGSYYI